MTSARNRSLPLRVHRAKDLRLRIPAVDYHLHTTFTDGTANVEDYVIRGLELGLEAIGFPEHANAGSTWLASFRDEIDNIRHCYDGRIEIVWGVESKTVDYEGGLSATEDMIEAAQFVYGAFHSSFTETKFPALPAVEAIDMEYRALIGIARNATADVLAHPGGLSEKYHGYFPLDMFEEIARMARSNGVIIEINSGYTSVLSKQVEICELVGAEIVLGSNAHAVKELGEIQRALTDLGFGN